MEKKLFKAFIRVVKSIGTESGSYFGGDNTVVRIPVIEAVDKVDVKNQLLLEYPQFFQNGKIYEKETKDEAQFFYVVIYPLYNYEIEEINKGEWVCASCGQVHENRYISKPRYSKLFGDDVLFCRGGDDGELCLFNYKKEAYKHIEFPDDENYIKKDNPIYIYKCTEKSTSKCYIGKTRNAPFFRWWNHLTHSISPFGKHLRTTKLSDWTFEVLEELPFETPASDVFKIESDYIIKFDSINNGYNSVISKKEQLTELEIQGNLFSEIIQ